MKKKIYILLNILVVCCLAPAPSMASSKSHKTRSTTYAHQTTHTFTPAYATLISPEPETEDWIVDQTIIVPITQIQTAKNITLDPLTHTFTVPKGTYFIHFQFVMKDRQTIASPNNFFSFTKMHLDINNDSAQEILDWAPNIDSSGLLGDFRWASFSGSKIFSVGADETAIKMVLNRDTPVYGAEILFSHPENSVSNKHVEISPVRITLHKINGCP